MRDEDTAKRLLDAIAAAPRGAGTNEEERARNYCSAFLREHGFSTSEEEFGYSAFAGRWGTPLAGAVLISMFAVLTLRGGSTNGAAAANILPVLAGHTMLLAAVGLLASRWSILRLPILRRRGVNLLARGSRESDATRLWLVAHLDSKSQPVSILARASGVFVSIVMMSVMVVLLSLQPVTDVLVAPQLWRAIGIAGMLAGLPLLLSIVANRSLGALDNASGVAAVLLAAAHLAKAGVSEVAILITSAEELGLAGAHAWSEGREPGLAINCDSVDDTGEFLCLAGRKRSGIVQRALAAAALASETRLHERRMLTGILVDSMALDSRGWETVTLSKGTLGSLRRIHTSADVPAACTGSGPAWAAILIRDASQRLLGHG